MKKIIITLVSVFLLVLTSCQTVGEGSAEDVFNFRQDNWSLVHDSDFSAIKEVYVPESYNGYTYQEVLALALSKIDDPYYELVWGEPTVISPNGEYAVYISNKPDVVNGVFSFMLLKINLNQESVALTERPLIRCGGLMIAASFMSITALIIFAVLSRQQNKFCFP